MQQVKITYTLALDLTQCFIDLQDTELQCIIQHGAAGTIHYSTQSIFLVVLGYSEISDGKMCYLQPSEGFQECKCVQISHLSRLGLGHSFTGYGTMGHEIQQCSVLHLKSVPM